MLSVKEKYNERIQNPRLNTSYPLTPDNWLEYRVNGQLPFRNNDSLSFYVHVPFCQHLCNFCEYTRTLIPNESAQNLYLNILKKDIFEFVNAHHNLCLAGFDIGGGTPTALSDYNFAYLMGIYQECLSMVNCSSDFEPSIEATIQTVTEEKLRKIGEVGIKRLSFGIQSSANRVLLESNRANVSVRNAARVMSQAYQCGIKKINVDLMYGLKNQTMESLENDIKVISLLRPEQVTLYELRTNLINASAYMSKTGLFNSYGKLYDGLVALGYHARFGQNTFSKDNADFGVSSYLRNRMMAGGNYKGFGVSSQSMNSEGISYNVGKNKKSLQGYQYGNSFENEMFYKLPKQELLSKYIAISAYSGRFSLGIASKMGQFDAIDYYKEEMDFCLTENLMEREGEWLYITKKGFKYYGAVFSLFYLKSYAVYP